MRPLILCSNDDGIDSPHLRALAARLQSVADVVVVAPERQRSAASHAITLHKPLRLQEVAPLTYALSGTPVDCVYVGMLRLVPRPPNLVVSGINEGYNLGSDIFYSGTVAAAMEGGLRGSVGLALSMADRLPSHAAQLDVAMQVIEAVLASNPSAGSVYNVNLPPLEAAHSPQLAWTRLGRRRYVEDVTERKDPWGRSYYWIGGGAVGHDPIADSDCEAIARGEVSITALTTDRTHSSGLTPAFSL